MELYDLLLIGHILGVVVMAFGTGAGLLSMLTAGREPDVATLARTARVSGIGGMVTSLAAIAVLLFGIALVVEGPWEFSESWISASFGLWVIAMAIGGAILGRRARRLAAGAEAARGRGETTNAELIAAFNQPIGKIAVAVVLVIYVLFVYLMVAKPGSDVM